MGRKAIDAKTKYERMKREAAARNAAASLTGRDIGELPKVKNPRRKKKCRDDLLAFCRNYFKAAFYLSFSPDQKKCISKVEATVKHGGRFAFAMPRGSGKSTILKIGCIWALFYGHRSFVALIQASETMAAAALDDIKMAIQTNDPRITLVAGGYPLFAHEKIAGGIGVGGGTEEQDCEIAEYVLSVFEKEKIA